MVSAYIITPHTLMKKLTTQMNSNIPLRLIEVGFNQVSVYRASHIPCADYIDTNEIEELPYWNIKEDSLIIDTFFKHTLNTDDQIVLYSRGSSAAARLAIVMLEFGFTNIALLDGGINGWIDATYPLDGYDHLHRSDYRKHSRRDHSTVLPSLYNSNKKNPASSAFRRREDSLIISHMHFKALQKFKPIIISIRSYDEFHGFSSGYDYFNAKGTIPNSLHGEDIGFYFTSKGHYLSPQRMSQHLDSLGITTKTTAYLYCGTSWRASEVLFLALSMGYSHMKLYDGGWYEWSDIERSSD